MNRIDEIKDLAFRVHNLFLYTKDNAIKAIDILQQNRIQIYGIDSFIIKEETIQPFMEYSPDYSNIESNRNIYTLAKEDLIKAFNYNSNFVFELVYEGY